MGILSSFQEEQKTKENIVASYSFATIGGIYKDGLSFIFPGSTSESPKHYKYNASCKFQPKQRVYIVKISGSYFVVCPIGP